MTSDSVKDKKYREKVEKAINLLSDKHNLFAADPDLSMDNIALDYDNLIEKDVPSEHLPTDSQLN